MGFFNKDSEQLIIETKTKKISELNLDDFSLKNNLFYCFYEYVLEVEREKYYMSFSSFLIKYNIICDNVEYFEEFFMKNLKNQKIKDINKIFYLAFCIHKKIIAISDKYNNIKTLLKNYELNNRNIEKWRRKNYFFNGYIISKIFKWEDFCPCIGHSAETEIINYIDNFTNLTFEKYLAIYGRALHYSLIFPIFFRSKCLENRNIIKKLVNIDFGTLENLLNNKYFEGNGKVFYTEHSINNPEDKNKFAYYYELPLFLVLIMKLSIKDLELYALHKKGFFNLNDLDIKINIYKVYIKDLIPYKEKIILRSSNPLLFFILNGNYDFSKYLIESGIFVWGISGGIYIYSKEKKKYIFQNKLKNILKYSSESKHKSFNRATFVSYLKSIRKI